MKVGIFFSALMLLAFPLAAQAQSSTPVDKQTANAYYENCVAKHDPRMSPESQAALCSCTSAMMMKEMSVEEIRAMSENTQEGRDALNHMLIDVYAPCMQYPVEDMVAAECMKDEKIGSENDPAKSSLCRCVAEKTGLWFSRDGRKLMENIITMNPNIVDPVGPVMDSPEFRKKSYGNMMACITNEVENSGSTPKKR